MTPPKSLFYARPIVGLSKRKENENETEGMTKRKKSQRWKLKGNPKSVGQKKNNRTDLLEVEQNEYDLLTSFLPKQLSDEDTKKICEETIKKIGASSIKDMGKVMGALKAQYSDEIDFSKAGSLLKELLNQS